MGTALFDSNINERQRYGPDIESTPGTNAMATAPTIPSQHSGSIETPLMLMIHEATFFEQCHLGTCPLRMGNKFLSGKFRLVMGQVVSHLVAR